MRRNMRDIFDSFSDETIELETTAPVSHDRIIELTNSKIKNYQKEHKHSKIRKNLIISLVAVVAVAVFSVSSAASFTLLSPRQAAVYCGTEEFAEYISVHDYQFEFESQTVNGDEVQIITMASGKGLTNIMDSDDKTLILCAFLDKEKSINLNSQDFFYHDKDSENDTCVMVSSQREGDCLYFLLVANTSSVLKKHSAYLPLCNAELIIPDEAIEKFIEQK